MIAQQKSAEVGKLQSEVAEKKSAEEDLQQKLTGTQGDKTQLKATLQKKEGEYVLDIALYEEHTCNQKALYTLHR